MSDRAILFVADADGALDLARRLDGGGRLGGDVSSVPVPGITPEQLEDLGDWVTEAMEYSGAEYELDPHAEIPTLAEVPDGVVHALTDLGATISEDPDRAETLIGRLARDWVQLEDMGVEQEDAARLIEEMTDLAGEVEYHEGLALYYLAY